jgi:hypothetical protein
MELEEELQGKVDELLEKEEAWSNERATVEAELTTAALAAEEYWKVRVRGRACARVCVLSGCGGERWAALFWKYLFTVVVRSDTVDARCLIRPN